MEHQRLDFPTHLSGEVCGWLSLGAVLRGGRARASVGASARFRGSLSNNLTGSWASLQTRELGLQG